jgi:beta-1,4-N-acetylglucosaminyltransferase
MASGPIARSFVRLCWLVIEQVIERIEKKKKKSKTKAMTHTLLVTVGSTKFDALIRLVDSEQFAQRISSELKSVGGLHSVIVQQGHGDAKASGQHYSELDIAFDSFDYSHQFSASLDKATLVISHAGAGSILETLALAKPMVVVVNDELMDNHQSELAQQMDTDGHCIAATVSRFYDDFDVERLFTLKPMPSVDCGDFGRLIDDEFGFDCDDRRVKDKRD